MAKKKIHIDELFRRELGDMKMPVDTNDWATMQAQIAAGQDKRKRRALWWWFAGIALLVAGSFATYYFLSSENTPQKEVIVENTTSTLSTENPEVTENQPEKGSNIENSTSSQSANNESSSPESVEAKTNDLPSSSSKPLGIEGKSVKPSESGMENFRKWVERNEAKRRKRNKNGSDEDKGEKRWGTPYQKDERRNRPKETTKPSIINEEDSATREAAIENKDSNTIKETPTEVTTPDSSKSVAISSDSTKINSDSLKQAKQEKKPTKGKDGTKPKLSPFSLGFSLGGTSNSFTAEDNSTFGRILNSGNQPALGFNALLSANYAIKNFEINSGLGINSITNSGSYNYTHQTKDSIPVLDPMNNIIGYFYTNFRDTTHNFNIQSRFTSITLPIGVSYKISLGDNSGLRLGANTSINYLVGASGEYINPFNLFQLNVSDNKDLFRTWNIGLGGSVGYYYQLKNGLTLEGSVNYNTLTNGIFDNRIGTAIRPSSIGVNVGIRYNFKLR